MQPQAPLQFSSSLLPLLRSPPPRLSSRHSHASRASATPLLQSDAPPPHDHAMPPSRHATTPLPTRSPRHRSSPTIPPHLAHARLLEDRRPPSACWQKAHSHVVAVAEMIERGGVVLPRGRLSLGNALHDEREATSQLVFTRSPILTHSRRRRVEWLPCSSNEVMLHSPILANSPELRAIAALG